MDDQGQKDRVYFGSLERDAVAYAKRKREEEEDNAQDSGTSRLLDISESTRPDLPGASIDLDSIDEAIDEKEDKLLTDDALETRRRAMAEFDRRRLARSIAVPTDDTRVKETLRQHGHPICLFGEDAGDRRNRLRYVLSKMAVEQKASESGGQTTPLSSGLAVEDKSGEISGEVSEGDEEQEEFYTEASDSLLQARQAIARFSLFRAQNRIAQQRENCNVDLANIRRLRQDLTTSLASYTIAGSQIGDARPMSRAVFTNDSRRLLTSSWSGTIKLWDIPECNMLRSYRGHTDRIGGLSLHPQAGERGESVVDFASGAADNNIFLWSLGKETPIGSLKGHQSRVVNVDHHPSGDYLGSASFDGSWRLWDISTERELLLQEGHSRELFALRFQCDGSLIATGGLDGIGRVWDMRSGRSIMVLEGHAKEIFAMDWSPNGFQIATGSADNTIRIFDLRKLATIQQIPAHKSIVTDVRFFHARNINPGHFDDMSDAESKMRLCDGQYLASASNDGLINIWTAGDWKLQKSLAGHVGKIMGLDIACNGDYIASVGYDKTFKIWSPEEIDSELWNEVFAGETASQFDSFILEELAIHSQRHAEATSGVEQEGADLPGGLVAEQGALRDSQHTPEQTRPVSSNLHPSPRSKICGSKITLGISDLASFVEDNATFVDKSAAIVDVMNFNSDRVISGLYPRRMGKTTFLQTLASFLGIIDEMPQDQRKQHFAKCAIYEFHREFFDANFAKYPVIMLDLKACYETKF
ncbi:hypothetical protein H4R24_004309 [Coemansia sp. RSA 988]|nr:hypothetical protein H4R24_004309 [Coemansia sp. RSA 988]